LSRDPYSSFVFRFICYELWSFIIYEIR
jgi:hypothetical protein